MKDYVAELRNAECQEGELLVMWVGQAGFLMKNEAGKILALDLYLSDLSMRLDGNKRLVPPIIDAEDVDPDLILVSHIHTDHLDIDSLPEMMKNGAYLYCTGDCLPICLDAKLPEDQIHVMNYGDTIEDSGYNVTAVFADHGDTAPDAVGFLIRSGGITFYFAGDGAYQCTRMLPAMEGGIDILATPINGEFNNMNENDAAMMADLAKANVTIPYHFWTFARHQGSPYLFEAAMKMLAPGRDACVMALGDIMKYDASGTWCLL